LIDSLVDYTLYTQRSKMKRVVRKVEYYLKKGMRFDPNKTT
jgi:hypothetical protein